MQAGSADGNLSGTIRLTAPVDHATQSVTPAMAEFARDHPQVLFDLHTADRVVDLVAEGIDLAIRLGQLRDSSLRAIKLGSFEQQVVAAPAYLRRAGVPRTPADLANHQWIEFSLMQTPLTWSFVRGEESLRVRVKPCMRVDSSASLRSLLMHGAGISVIDQFSVEAAISEGTLVHLLPAWSLPRGGVYAVLPPGRHAPANVRAFIDFYRDYLGRHRGRVSPAAAVAQ
jgi:DNA-binding transcriptional LysR family regulator